MRTTLALFAAAGIAIAATLLLTPAVPAAARTAATCAAPGSPTAPGPAWAQQALAPQRIWPFTTGAGITVAVLDSGVDRQQPRLQGRVLAGYDMLGGGNADDDCLGTGTQVAGVIAARPASGDGLVGIAPGVQILPIRVVSSAASDGGSVADAGVLANGIESAVAHHADVIAVTAVTYDDTDALAAAVADALRQGITVVAAVGDQGGTDAGNPKPYPAAYPGVIGVGAIDQTGARWASSQHGTYVDLMAPGVDVLTLARDAGLSQRSGTALACGFVAATAALLRARWGGDLPASEVPEVLLGTATPAATGPFYGHGIVDPYAAVNGHIIDATPVPLPKPRPAGGSLGLDDATRHRQELAMMGAGVAVLATLAVVVLALAVPRGRRRFWRGTLARRPAGPREPEEPGPPIPLFPEAGSAPRSR
ncbi:MAG TPA: S8 family serine peptidase [Micromonosporaceae bacterium]